MKLLKLTLIGLITTFSLSAQANDYKCSTPRKNIIINMVKNKIQLDGRTPAQAVVQRSSRVGNSVSKFYTLNGQKHQIHFGDIKNSNEMNTYISIKTHAGHEVTYPLSCNRI